MKISRKLPCGLTLNASQFNDSDVILVNLEDPSRTSFATHSDGLTIGINPENLPVLQEILNEFLQPNRPIRTFSTRLRAAWAALRG